MSLFADLFADWPVFVGLTLCLFGAAAWLMGRALGQTWRPAWQVGGYALLLSLFDRFLHFALFGGYLLSAAGLLRDLIAIAAVALAAFRIARVRRMVAQYPWLYEKRHPFAWRER